MWWVQDGGDGTSVTRKDGFACAWASPKSYEFPAGALEDGTIKEHGIFEEPNYDD
jgi:hypothetical protein